MESARIAAQFRSARQIGGTYASIPDAFKAVNNGFFGSARVPFTITQIRADMPRTRGPSSTATSPPP
jgi:hypothetical protein